jgi:hypothetical protein
MEVSGKLYPPTAFSRGKSSQYSLVRRLGEFQYRYASIISE